MTYRKLIPTNVDDTKTLPALMMTESLLLESRHYRLESPQTSQQLKPETNSLTLRTEIRLHTKQVCTISIISTNPDRTEGT
jgi:hypothetical protein